MEFVVTSGGLPVGVYACEFIGAEAYNENVEKFGEAVAEVSAGKVLRGPEGWPD
jgi:hypothetical protein